MNIEASEENFENPQQESLEKTAQDLYQENLAIISADLREGSEKDALSIHNKGIDCLYHDTRSKVIIGSMSIFLTFAMVSSQIFQNRNIDMENLSQVSTPAALNITPPESIIKESPYIRQDNKTETKDYSLSAEFFNQTENDVVKIEEDNVKQEILSPLEVSSLSLRVIDSNNPIPIETLEEEIIPNLVVLRDVFPDIAVINENIQLNKICIEDLGEMLESTKKENIHISIRSGFRSFEQQQIAYNQAPDKTTVTLPGYSQHHTGLAIDFTSPEIGNVIGKYARFGETETGSWLIANSWKYGFVLAYTNNHDGVMNEDWHYYYVGKDLAKIWHDTREKDATFDLFTLQEEYRDIINH